MNLGGEAKAKKWKVNRGYTLRKATQSNFYTVILKVPALFSIAAVFTGERVPLSACEKQKHGLPPKS
jgi:hypothetical protein